MADFLYDIGDEVKIIGDLAHNRDVGELGKIEKKIISDKGQCYQVMVHYNKRIWNVYEKDLELMNAIGDVIPEETIKNSSMAIDPAYCNCNGPSELRRFDTFSYDFCLSCRKEKK